MSVAQKCYPSCFGNLVVVEVETMTPDDLLDLIGIEISPARLKCALLSLETVAHALADDARKQAEARTEAKAEKLG